MRIFVTGGTGFIGSHFLRAAMMAGHGVLALRRPGSMPKIQLRTEPDWLEQKLDDVTVENLAGCEVLMHLASPGVSPKQAGFDELFYWNVSVLIKLLNVAKIAGVRRVVIAGTGLEYGQSAGRFEYIPPDAPLLPTSAYAASKAAGCIAATSYAAEHGMQLAYLRIFSAYGEGQFEQNFWPALRHAALSGRDFPMTAGEQIRDFIPVEEVAARLVLALTHPNIEVGVPYVANIGSGHPVSLSEFAADRWTEWRATGKLLVGVLPYRENEVMRLVPEIKP